MLGVDPSRAPLDGNIVEGVRGTLDLEHGLAAIDPQCFCDRGTRADRKEVLDHADNVHPVVGLVQGV